KNIIYSVSIIVALSIGVACFNAYQKYNIENMKAPINNTTTKSVSEDSDTKNEPDAKKETTETPAKINKVIVIDPGHANRSNLEKEPIAPNSSEMKIKDGGGTEGVVTKNPEYVVNMQVSLKLKSILEQRGYTVKMTKTSNSESLGNVERADIWNKDNADLVIRIHADSSESSGEKGASMLIPDPINDNTKAIFNQSKLCGQVVLDTLTKEVGMRNKGVVQRNDMTGFNWSGVPVILVEMGFLSNPDEDRLLGTEEYQNKIALGLADGISAVMK
ncbi:MAG: N-acetylmuramoyl-L-alanine amidase family protein, partial [Solirubrobacterales bacterium]